MECLGAWEKFKKSGNIKDYLAYRSEIAGRSSDLSSIAVNNILGVNREDTNKRFNNSGIGLWRKR